LNTPANGSLKTQENAMSANQKQQGKNPCGRQVTVHNAYEVWQTDDGQFTTFVLKKYQTPEREAQNPWAKWFVATTNLNGGLDYGDSYAAEVKRDAHKLDTNPLTGKPIGEAHE
jgi:hypothetical protein